MRVFTGRRHTEPIEIEVLMYDYCMSYVLDMSVPEEVHRDLLLTKKGIIMLTLA